ncbi:IcfG protein [Xylanibacter ruminicola]|uniref:Cache/HAMP/SpoIIE domain protein n=2 Tax=Xylanibacter ruminicola TaxID=839 RepID=D5EYQ6_XYLR2|nr:MULTISPECIES: SpoIIE family protein phosphatase [Prevotellaceae]ADE81495.1 cache/HAMP/SpoIIE domain protein [Xylanibacter ruminicola 23]QVJ82058.1 SpoIIE family protein phosphatase [Xylanibacter ruminicola]SDQ83599.1 sigma-B regulation protein RsbU (phosphoserine phosphatase) [Prevotella sp. khp1]SEH81793.1 sigma-B regulation protein RsbU (phosphoserine phosphatase) [Xylanibacter ruminicola]GJG32318.1 IcfG protein [Xylanibacter ruminicola]
MNEVIAYIRRKLSIRVSLWVVMFAAVIFVAALGFLFYQSREAVRQEAIHRATTILDRTSLQVEGILNRVEVATNMTVWLVQRHPNVADSMFVYSEGTLRNNPDFYSCSIAFEPYYFKEYGRYFSAYSKYEGDSIRTLQGGSDNYQYFFMDWYLMPTLLGHPCWTDPYMDLDAPTNTYEMVTTYCQAIKNKQGAVIGVINTSLSINWLSQTISAVKPYPNSYSIMIGRGGTYFVHPDSTKITRQTIFTQTMLEPDTALTALGHAMQRGEEGMRRMVIDGKDSYVFYKPLGKTGCSMAIVCPESDIFGGFNRLRHTVMGIVFVGLLVMLCVFINVITRELKPLHRLAREAETIASGNFDAELPDFERTDEIGQLSHSFGYMQQSLVRYIDELKLTTAQKASIESELNVASNIQMSMLPSVFPNREGLDMHASMTPAKEVGGDLYGYLLKGDNLYFCVGDVSGKGVPASLFMAQVTRLFRTLANQQMAPADICTHMNEALSGDENPTNMFVTMFVGMVNLQSGHLKFCNAGHNPPVIGGGEHHGEFLQMLPNFPIGVLPGLEFQGEEIDTIKGRALFLYTDGLNEAENREHEQFGDDQLLSILRNTHFESAQQVVETLYNEVQRHRDGADPNDDLTMMCLRMQ